MTTTISEGMQQSLRDKNEFYANKFGVSTFAMQAALHDIFSMLSLDNVGPYADPAGEVLADLKERCERAVRSLDDMIDEGDFPSDAARKAAKRDGVKLALSYINETIRGMQR